MGTEDGSVANLSRLFILIAFPSTKESEVIAKGRRHLNTFARVVTFSPIPGNMPFLRHVKFDHTAREIRKLFFKTAFTFCKASLKTKEGPVIGQNVYRGRR